MRKGSSIFSGERRPSPLVGDHDRVGRDMIVVVEIVAGRLMREALPRQTCQFVIVLETNNGLPRGVTGFHLEAQLTGSNEYPK